MSLFRLDARGHQILGTAWVLLGIMLPIFYLTPLFGTALYDLNGIDVMTAVDDLSKEKLKTFDRFTGILMFVLPQLMLFTGFLAIGLGIHSFVKKKGVLLFPLSILAATLLVVGLFTAFRLDEESTGFFALLKPTAQYGFYVMLVLLAMMGLTPVIISALKPSQEKVAF